MSALIRLLIIDHDPGTRLRYQAVLEELGYSSVFAASGAEARQRIGANEVDGVIANSLAPGLDLLDLAGCPGAAGASPSLLVFSTAAEGAGHPPARCLWLRQPVTPVELHLALDCVLNYAGRLRKSAPFVDQKAIFAHEFRSPLASIRMTVDTLGQGYYGGLLPQQEEAVERIERNVGYLEDTLNCVEDLHELEARPIVATGKSVETVELGAEVVAPILARPDYRDNHKRMSLSLAVSEPLRVVAEPRLLAIVVNNLINNAIKYGQAGTDIAVRIDRAGERAILSVRNEGIGIPATDMKRLFTRFGRLKQPGSEGIKGSGLGLYLCRRIVSLLGGSIEASSEPGKYAEFRVALSIV
jgi:signal transduction histidine kinase